MHRFAALACLLCFAGSLAATEVHISGSWHDASAVPLDGIGASRRLKPGSTVTLGENEGLQIETWSLDVSDLGYLCEVDAKAPILELALCYNFLTDEGFREACKLKRLKRLEIQCRDKLTDDGFAAITALEHLEALELHDTNIGNKGLALLSDLPALHTLTVWGLDNVTSDGFAGLGALPHLKNLRLYFNPQLDGASMVGVARIESLQSLDVHLDQDISTAYASAFHGHRALNNIALATDQRDAGAIVRELAGIPELAHVALRCGRMLADEDLAPLAGLRKLETLNLSDHPKIKAIGFSAFAKHNTLKVLNLGGCAIGDAGAAELSRIESLQRLNLAEQTRITDAGFSSLCKLHGLTSLVVSLCGGISASGFGPLVHLTSLRELNLSGTCISDDSLPAICTLTQLEVLDLSGTNFTSAGAAHLASLTLLRDLSLEGCELFGDRGMRHLAGLPKLESLDLAHSGITGRGLKHLAGLKSLRNLDLECTNVDDAGLALLKDSAVQHLTLTDCTKLTTACATSLKEMDQLRWVFMRSCGQVDAQLIEAEVEDEDTQVWSSADATINADPGEHKREAPELPAPADPEEDQS